MDIPRMSNFRPIDRDTGFLLPPSVDEWLPEKHLARFVVEAVIAVPDRRRIIRECCWAFWITAVRGGVFRAASWSVRRTTRWRSGLIAANDHPDHDTIAAFRRRFLAEIEALFVQVLLLAREMGVLQMGTSGLDGTKIHATASRHSALSHEHAGKIEAQLQAEVADLLAKAEAADAADLPDDLSIPDELGRSEERLRQIGAARTKIEARAKESHARDE